MATPGPSSRLLPPGRTPGSQRKVSDSHTLRALAEADTPKNTRQPFASTSHFSQPRVSLAPAGLPATPGRPDLGRRKSVAERTPRQVLAAQRLVPKSARKSLGGNRGGKNESPGELLRQLSRMADLPPGTPDTPDPPPRADAADQPERRRSSLLSRPSITAQPTPPPSDPPTAPDNSQLPAADITASPVASTSTASPFGTTATLSHAHSASRSAAGPSSLARYPIPNAPDGFRHPHFVPGYGRQSMGSPGVGRRVSTATSGLAPDEEGDEEDDSGSFGRYGAARKSEVYSEVGNVSIGVSEGYFGGSRSVRTSLAISQRSSFGTVIGEADDDEDTEGAEDSEEDGGHEMERSLSRISSAADEEVYPFSRFRLSDESDGTADEEDEEAEGEEGGDYGDEEGARALSDPAGIDWDDVLRDVGQGGGDEEEDEEERASLVGASDKGKGRQVDYDDDEEDDQPQQDDYYGQDSDDQAVDEHEASYDTFERAPLAGKLPKPPPLAKAAAACKKRVLPKKATRTTPSGAPLADLPTNKVKAAFEHATGGAFTLGPEGVDAVMEASHEFFQNLMADAVQVAHQSGRKARVDGGDLVILLYKSGVLTPSCSLSQLSRQLGLDRELQSVLDAESRRFEVRVAKLLQKRRGRKKRASEAGEQGGEERGGKRTRKAKAVPVAVEKPRSKGRSGKGKTARK